MLRIGVDDLMHIDKPVENLGIASIFEIAILPSPVHIVFVNSSSQLQEYNVSQSRKIVMRRKRYRSCCQADSDFWNLTSKDFGEDGAKSRRTGVEKLGNKGGQRRSGKVIRGSLSQQS